MAAKSSSAFDCILVDLDDTLYSGDLGINAHMRANIEGYLMANLRVSRETAVQLRSDLFRTYGSTFIGLRAQGYNVHPDDYHSYVHGRLPYNTILPDPCVQEILRSIPQTKILFTNSDRAHVRRVLERLGIDERVFSRIICFETLNPHLFESSSRSTPGADVVLKPSSRAIEIAISIAGTDPHRTLFLDDSERNIAAGKALGLRTALVGKKGKRIEEADYVVDSARDLRLEIPEIWHAIEEEADENKRGGGMRISEVLLRHRDLDPNPMATATYVEA